MLSERLRELRERAGLAARPLDRLAGLGEGHVNMIERGERPNIEAETARALARVFGCSLDWLIAGMGRPPTDAALRRAVARAQREFDARPSIADSTPRLTDHARKRTRSAS